MPRKATFNKEAFKKAVKDNVKTLFRKTIEEASEQQIYQAVCYAVKDTELITGLQLRKHMRSRIQRQYIIYQWNSLWEELLVIQ